MIDDFPDAREGEGVPGAPYSERLSQTGPPRHFAFYSLTLARCVQRRNADSQESFKRVVHCSSRREILPACRQRVAHDFNHFRGLPSVPRPHDRDCAVAAHQDCIHGVSNQAVLLGIDETETGCELLQIGRRGGNKIPVLKPVGIVVQIGETVVPQDWWFVIIRVQTDTYQVSFLVLRGIFFQFLLDR